MDTADFIFVGSLVGFGVSAFASGWMCKRRHFQHVTPWRPTNGKLFNTFYIKAMTAQPTGPTRVKHVHRISDLPRGAKVDTKVWQLLRDDDVLPTGVLCYVEVTAYEPDYEPGILMAGDWSGTSTQIGALTKRDAHYINLPYGSTWGPPADIVYDQENP